MHVEAGHAAVPVRDLFFKVENIHCAGCVDKVSRALEASKLCESFWVDRSNNVLRVRPGHKGISKEAFTKEIIATLKKAGYPAKPINDPTHAGRNEWILQLVFTSWGLALSYFVLPHMSEGF